MHTFCKIRKNKNGKEESSYPSAWDLDKEELKLEFTSPDKIMARLEFRFHTWTWICENVIRIGLTDKKPVILG